MDQASQWHGAESILYYCGYRIEPMEVEKLASKKEGGLDKKRKKIDVDGSDDLQVDATSEVAAGPVDIKDSEIDSKPQQRYGHGCEGTLCDVCFMGEGEGETSFIKCRECLLVVHSDCYFADGAMRIDDKGFFDCDACRALKEGHGGKVKKNPKYFTPSPDPLSKYIEAKSDGRNYPTPTDKNEALDIFCQICARRDVSGGMKETDAGKWVHLACMMTTKEAYIDFKGLVVLPSKMYRRTKEELEEIQRKIGRKPACEACFRSNAVLLRCAEDKCHAHLHPLCAELSNRERVVTAVDKGEIVQYRCAKHSDGGLHAHSCVICGLGTKWEDMLSCDGCDRWYHFFCLKPQLKEVPDGDWFCSDCHEIGGRMLGLSKP